MENHSISIMKYITKYKCNYCAKSYTESGNLKMHINSDVPILGLRPRTARTEGFLGGPRPYKDRSSKTERPAVFFGPQIRQFLGVFWVNFWYFYYLWVKHLFWPHPLLHLMIRDSGAVQVHAKIVD